LVAKIEEIALDKIITARRRLNNDFDTLIEWMIHSWKYKDSMKKKNKNQSDLHMHSLIMKKYSKPKSHSRTSIRTSVLQSNDNFLKK
jgi:hypothetical protein